MEIGAYGLETMGKLIQMKVLISGMRGAGVEIAKNLILAGPNSVCVHDNVPTSIQDLGSNFYLTEEDIGKPRAEACVSKLASLNPYVKVSSCGGELTPELVSQYSVVVLTESCRSEQLQLNQFCRDSNIGFICVDALGLASRVFVDYGKKFVTFDRDGAAPRSAIVEGITQDNPAMVYTHSEKRHGLKEGDHVVFEEVQGMDQINKRAPAKILEVTGPFGFKLDLDTSNMAAYEREGIVSEVKVPHEMHFMSLAESELQPVGEGEHMLITPDLSKFGQSEQLHVAVLGVKKLMEKRWKEGEAKLPTRNSGVISEALAEAEEVNKLIKEKGGLAVDEVDRNVVRLVASFASCSFSPLGSFLGGVVAQEIVKFTGKFSPLNQSLYFDMFEVLPEFTGTAGITDPSEFAPSNSRYDEQVAIIGRSGQEKLEKSRLFLVGAGALGCEFLKSFALMGASCGGDQGQGEVVVTDMDRIETSNLNRQFLFRAEHVGKQKSFTAAMVAKSMNKDLKVSPMEVRVGPETEETFNDEFWQRQDCVVNALDNVQARLYVDGRCVWFERPLLESGTLGTKGNVQVVLPHTTQSYGDSQDPPEESIPLCTLKHFPHKIEHTIEWARDVFQGLFADIPNECLNYVGSPSSYLKKLLSEGNTASQKETLVRVKNLVQAAGSTEKRSFESCVSLALDLYTSNFHHMVAQLLHNFPLGHLTTEGTPFWSGPKRAPQVLRFEASDDLHLHFILAAANLFADNMGVQPERDVEKVRALVKELPVPEFRPKNTYIKADENDTAQEGGEEDEKEVIRLAQEMENVPDMVKAQCQQVLKPAEFEKDDDSNFHIDFIFAAANLRARNYKIHEAERHKVKMIAGKIIPAIATTTAMTVGLVSCELVKLLTNPGGGGDKQPPYRIETFKNCFVDLALPQFVLYEPMPPVKTVSKDMDPISMGPVKAQPEGFTPWMKITVDLGGDVPLKQLIDHLEEKENIEIMILSAGNACLYNSFVPGHKPRLEESVSALVTKISKLDIPASRNYVCLEVSSAEKDGDADVVIPTIKYVFRK